MSELKSACLAFAAALCELQLQFQHEVEDFGSKDEEAGGRLWTWLKDILHTEPGEKKEEREICAENLQKPPRL